MTYLYSLRGTNLLITQLLTICIEGLPSSTISPKSQPPRKPPHFRPQKITLPATFKKVKEEIDFKNPDIADVNLQMFASLADTRHKHADQPRNSRQSVPLEIVGPQFLFSFLFQQIPIAVAKLPSRVPLAAIESFFHGSSEFSRYPSSSPRNFLIVFRSVVACRNSTPGFTLKRRTPQRARCLR